MQHEDTLSQRKNDHIALAFEAQVQAAQLDNRFYYEPLLAAHPNAELKPFSFLGKTMNAPLWISSMTGGTGAARHINQNLAKVCGEFGLGMGLGSTRPLLESDDFFADFDLRESIGTAHPFFVNLGIAQIEKSLSDKSFDEVGKLVERLRADGLIIHVNPMQEWLQPEGDHISRSPLEIIQEAVLLYKKPIIVKEVGQGFGPESIKALLQLPLAAIDFAAAGGTNFARLELLRSDEAKRSVYEALAKTGHSAEDMVRFTNSAIAELGKDVRVKEVIVSGGVKTFLDGYYLTQKLKTKSVYGQGAVLLKYAAESYESLRHFVELQLKGFQFAQSFLKVK